MRVACGRRARGSGTHLGDQDSVANRHTHGQTRASLGERTGSNSQNLALVQLLNARLGQEDAAGRLGLSLDALDQDTVQQGDEGLDRSDSGGLKMGGELISHSPRIMVLRASNGGGFGQARCLGEV